MIEVREPSFPRATCQWCWIEAGDDLAPASLELVVPTGSDKYLLRLCDRHLGTFQEELAGVTRVRRVEAEEEPPLGWMGLPCPFGGELK